MTAETSSPTLTPVGVAEALAVRLATGLPGATPINAGHGVPTDVPADAPALRIVLAGATRATVVVSVWAAPDGQDAPDAESLVAILGPALVETGLGDDGEVEVVPAGTAFADVDDSVGHVVLGTAGQPVGAVVVQLATPTPAAPTTPDPVATDATTDPVVDAVPAQRTDPYQRMASDGGSLTGTTPVAGPRLELLRDVELAVTAELGRTRMSLRELLSLAPGTVVELDRAAGSPVDLLVNGTLVARGEVVIVDEEFGVRITELVHSENAGESPR